MDRAYLSWVEGSEGPRFQPDPALSKTTRIARLTASKNAILIVEFARELHAQGKGIAEAAAEAAQRRFRPILMTSFAFILGVFPLVVAEGAGAASRRALGTAVFGGMIASTFLAVFFVPVFYVVMQRFSEWRRKAIRPNK